jgi:hypothetical protein
MERLCEAWPTLATKTEAPRVSTPRTKTWPWGPRGRAPLPDDQCARFRNILSGRRNFSQIFVLSMYSSRVNSASTRL